MIKVKLTDSNNMKCFSGLIHTKDLLRDYSIDITESDDYDYEFVHADEFVNLSLPLQESIDRGVDNLSKKSGDYFLFHGGDSTSIMGAYEVFIESDAKFLKIQLTLPTSLYPGAIDCTIASLLFSHPL